MTAREGGSRKRKILIWSLGGLLLVAGVLGAGLAARGAGNKTASKGKKSQKKEAVPPAPVELSQVHRGRIDSYLYTTAALEPRNAATLVARRQGQVVALLAEEGRWARAGEVLARLDDTEARLAVQRAEVAAEMAQREAERGKQLNQQGFLSAKELDDLKLKLRNAQLELDQARYDLSQTVLRAPFSGRVLERMVNLGESVEQGKECFRLADSDPVRLRLYFPERELPRVHLHQEALLTLDTHPGRQFTGRVALVNPAVDRSTGTFKVTIELPNRDGALRLGAFARVRLKTATSADALLLPRKGVLNEDGEDYVFIARGDSVQRVAVAIGAVEGDTAEILRGLREGDNVVTVGQGGLKPGAKIKPVSL